jgi:hypothetical protein
MEAAMRLRQAGQIFYRILDGLGRLGIVPRELMPLAVFCADFVVNLAAVFWIGAKQIRARMPVGALSQRPAAATG